MKMEARKKYNKIIINFFTDLRHLKRLNLQTIKNIINEHRIIA